MAAVDDHPIVLRGVEWVMAGLAPDIRMVAVESTVDDLLAGPGRDADVVLLDLLLRDGKQVSDNVERIRAAGPGVVIYTGDQRSAQICVAVRAGALGLVLKADDDARIVDAVRAAHRGEFFVSSQLAHAMVTDPRARIRLSAKEFDVLRSVASGQAQKQVAKRLNIELGTLRTYLQRVAAKYAAAGRIAQGTTELVALALTDGHIELPAPTGPNERNDDKPVR